MGEYTMVTLNVDREIKLRLFQSQDSPKLYKLINENRYHLREWLPWVDSVTSPYQCDSVISLWLQQFSENNAFNAGIFYYRELVGSIGLHQIDWQNNFASIGYFLAKKAEGRGIITRSVKSILYYAFTDLGLNRIEIRCGINNKKSRAIPEKLGFVAEGRIREGENLSGRFHDLILYSMLAREWTKISQSGNF
jgi:ribosomal-protein-serine acetyltransferase